MQNQSIRHWPHDDRPREKLLKLGEHRLSNSELLTRPQIQSSKDIVDILMPCMRDLKKEVFKVVFLNSQNRIIANRKG